MLTWVLRTGVAALIGMLSMLPPATVIAIVEPLSVEELTARSDLVAILRIVSVFEPASNSWFATITARPVRVIKGEELGCQRKLEIKEGKGISTAVEYEQGALVLAFLDQRDACVFATVNSYQGALVVHGDRVEVAPGERVQLEWVVRQIEAAMR